MGKGDKKSRRGKIVIGSYGVRRPRKTKHTVTALPSGLPAAPEKEITKPATRSASRKSEVVTDPETKPKSPRGKKKTEPEPPAAE